MTRDQAILIFNPVARGNAEAVAGAAAETLRQRGLRTRLIRTQCAGDGIRAAREEGGELVISVGGDGTAREVAQGLAESLGTWPTGGPAGEDAPLLLILPAGTGNSMHKALWSDRTWQETLDAALDDSATRRDVDLARITPTPGAPAVLLGASAGFLRWAVESTDRFPDLSGRDLYAAAGLAAAQELRPFPGRITVNGSVLVEGPVALAAVGGSLLLFPRSVLDDALLDVCVLTADGPDDAMAQLLAAMDGSHLSHPGVHYAQGRDITLECLDGPLPFEHDGDLWPGTEQTLRLSVVPAAVPTVAPPTWDE
jgi:diacylglycerol kinase (ATP)